MIHSSSVWSVAAHPVHRTCPRRLCSLRTRPRIGSTSPQCSSVRRPMTGHSSPRSVDAALLSLYICQRSFLPLFAAQGGLDRDRGAGLDVCNRSCEVWQHNSLRDLSGVHRGQVAKDQACRVHKRLGSARRVPKPAIRAAPFEIRQMGVIVHRKGVLTSKLAGRECPKRPFRGQCV